MTFVEKKNQENKRVTGISLNLQVTWDEFYECSGWNEFESFNFCQAQPTCDGVKETATQSLQQSLRSEIFDEPETSLEPRLIFRESVLYLYISSFKFFQET